MGTRSIKSNEDDSNGSQLHNPMLHQINKEKRQEIENDLRLLKDKYSNKSVVNIMLYGTLITKDHAK